MQRDPRRVRGESKRLEKSFVRKDLDPNMLSKLAAVVLLCGLATTVAVPVLAQGAPPTPPPAPAAAPPPSSATTGHFTSFFTQILAGHAPGGNVSSAVRSGLTQDVIAKVDAAFASLGKFRELQFVSADTMQQYQRYHYRAVFEQGSQGVMFVIDSNGTIVGFFQDPSAASPQ
jgi:hypothetical protein